MQARGFGGLDSSYRRSCPSGRGKDANGMGMSMGGHMEKVAKS